MEHTHSELPDFGTGQKKFGIYLVGIIICALLTLAAFWVVMSGHFSRVEQFVFIYTAAVMQFFVQVLCFLRLNLQTTQSRMNVMTIIFTIVILTSIIIGSLWIMSNLHYYMM